MIHLLRKAAVIAVALVLAGCGRANCPPSSPGAPPNQPPPPAVKPDYGFGLPAGDRSPDQRVESTVYVEIANRRCKTADSIMRRPEGPGWRGFDDPRAVLLFQAAVELCGNNDKPANPAQARRLWDAVSSQYGNWNAIGWTDNATRLIWHVCELYKSVGSALLQQSKDSLPCRLGEIPAPVAAWQQIETDRPDPRASVTR